jgi:hypothetical protein
MWLTTREKLESFKFLPVKPVKKHKTLRHQISDSGETSTCNFHIFLKIATAMINK